MLEDTININNLCWNPAVLKKKLVKPLKNCFFGPNLHRKTVIMDYVQDEKKSFLVEITKEDHQLSERFYFIKISYVLTELWIFFFCLQWCFLSKKCHFQQKQLCRYKARIWIIDFDQFNCGFCSNIAFKCTFMLARLLWKSFIFICLHI